MIDSHLVIHKRHVRAEPREALDDTRRARSCRSPPALLPSDPSADIGCFHDESVLPSIGLGSRPTTADRSRRVGFPPIRDDPQIMKHLDHDRDVSLRLNK